MQLFHSSCIRQKREGHEWEVDYGSVTGFHVYIDVYVVKAAILCRTVSLTTSTTKQAEPRTHKISYQ